METIQDRINSWANTYVPIYNELSEKYNTSFYTQSPLSKITSEIEMLIIGINPKGDFGNGMINISPSKFLDGNETWDQRFLPDGTIHKDWSKFLGGTHYFLGYSHLSHVNDYIDDDSKTVWTNFCPFPSSNGFAKLPKEIVSKCVLGTLELINILKPKKIVLLSSTGFHQIDKYVDIETKKNIQYMKVIDNQNLFIGRINNIPTVCVNHPSGHWAISNRFTSIFIFLYFFTDTMKDGKPLHKLEWVCEQLRNEYKSWVKNIEIKE